MITEDTTMLDHDDLPKYAGKISGVRKFDAQFFKVTYNQAISLEPMSRKLMEHAYSAIYDSGVNPLIYKGKKVGVFVGSSYSDYGSKNMYNIGKQNSFLVSGSSKAMMSNRFSYWLDSKAPSYNVDCACSSAMVCLDNAYNCIKTGICEAAVVGGCQLCCSSILTVNLKRNGFLCMDGKTKCFDKNGDGFVRSEAVNVLFIQKAKDAKRIYAEIFYTKIQYNIKSDAKFNPLRKSKDLTKFLEDCYSEAGVSPNNVEYVEAHGAGISEADANELESIGQIFGQEKSILVGSVKSNMGNSEPASGVCAITKMCLAYFKGKIPANLHYSKPMDIFAIQDKRVEVLTENTPFSRGFTAVNNFSYNGVNCHVLLKGHFKTKEMNRYDTPIPRLILVSGRHEKAVEKILKLLSIAPIDPEVIGMMHNIYQVETTGHTWRGYTILDKNNDKETVALSQSVGLFQGALPPLCLVFTGMGSQWPSMGAALMHIPIFSAAIEKCRKVLEPKGIDIVRIITDPDDAIFDNILNCFVGIAAVQIGLTDILKEMGVVPDYIIGHSVGEMGCAYFDGCFSTEEMILASYYRGLVSLETKFIDGLMAAIGLGYNDILPLCPPEIDVACHNSSESCTISGPSDILKQFVRELKDNGIFAKEVKTGNIAYHSRYIKMAGNTFIEYFKTTVKTQERSEKWICTSLPKEKWDCHVAKYSSPEYHTNNLLNPVYFEESAKLIPSNAVVVEVAPHGLLQAILKKSHKECTHIPLTRRDHSDPVKFLFEAIGKLYQEGFNPKIDIFYPKIEFPVATETPLLSHFVDWDHSEEWDDIGNTSRRMITTPTRKLDLSIQDDEHKFLAGHIRNGKNVLPEAAVIFLVWETLAMYKGVNYKDMSVIFNNIQFNDEINIDVENVLKLTIAINKGTNYFEIIQNHTVFANGYVTEILKTVRENIQIDSDLLKEVFLNSEDIYKLMHFKGHSYEGEFRSISSMSLKNNVAKVKWFNNWVTFLDSLFQLNILVRNYDGVTVPRIIRNLFINTVVMKESLLAIGNGSQLVAQYHKLTGRTKCGGVELVDIVFEDKVMMNLQPNILEYSTFIPLNLEEKIKMETALQLNLQLVSENISENTITIKIISDTNMNTYLNSIYEILINKRSQFNIHVERITTNRIPKIETTNLLCTLVILMDIQIIPKIQQVIENSTFVLVLNDNRNDVFIQDSFSVITRMLVDEKIMTLLTRVSKQDENIAFISISHNDKYNWVPQVTHRMKKSSRVVIVSDNPPDYGLIGFVKSIRKTSKINIGLVIVDDLEMKSFDPSKELFKAQLRNNLTINILRKGQWGNYFYVPISINELNSFKLITTLPSDGNTLKQLQTTQKNFVQVYFAGPTISERKTEHREFGMYFSGIDNRGNKIMSMVPPQSSASILKPDPNLVWPVPNHWTLEEAATVPLPYVHALYCLAIRSQICTGNSVFVTDGTAALGQALISICLRLKCTVYSSVPNSQNKRFLMRLFPELSENNIDFTYNCDFRKMIITNTKNKCCDFVINCYSGSLREAAMQCVGFNGIFLDVNSMDMKENKAFGMSYLWQARTYKFVNFSTIFRPENFKEKKLLQLAVSEGIAKGYIKPISHVVYSSDDLSKAFNISSNTGIILIKAKEFETCTTALSGVPSIRNSYNGLNIVVCDDTDLGIELTNRLIKRGARNILLNMKSKDITGFLQARFKTWLELGANVRISTEILQHRQNFGNLFRNKNELASVHGIYIIQERFGGTNYDYNQQDFAENMKNITSVVYNLDILSREHFTDLKNFVVITRNSTNPFDEYITSTMDRICENRTNIGLPALMVRVKLMQEVLPSSDYTSPQLGGNHSQGTSHIMKNVTNSSQQVCESKVKPQHVDTILNALETSLKQNYNSVITYYLKGYDKKDKAIKLSNNKFNSGFKAFFTFVDSTVESMVSDPFVLMSSLSGKNYDQKDALDSCLILIPGFEGHHRIFKLLCNRLKIRAETYELKPDLKGRSIPEMALTIKQDITKKFEMKKKFYLLGYSFGVNIALEIAALLEKEDQIGVVFCLESSPDTTRVQLDAYLGKLTEQQLQNALIEHLFFLMSGQQSQKLAQDIKKIDNWANKVELCIEELKYLVKYANQYKRDVLNSAYTKIMLARCYKPNILLKSELVLIKGIPHPNAESLPFDYDLSKYTNQPVRVFNIKADVAVAPQDCRVSNIINQMLDPELLDSFKTKNLCVSYMLDPNTIK